MDAQHRGGAETTGDQEEELLRLAPLILDWRREAGLEGLVGGLDAVIISTEQDRLVPAAAELLQYTGMSCSDAFSGHAGRSWILTCLGSASIILQARMTGANPFSRFNTAPLAKKLRNTRLETLVFTTPDIYRYIEIQKEQGIVFQTQEPVRLTGGLFIQTTPSRYTGNALGFVEWHDDCHSYRPENSVEGIPLPGKPPLPYLDSIGRLDHAATRVRAHERNAAIIEFLLLTNYHYDFAVYVKSLNSITSVARRDAADFAMVFTSGITPGSADIPGSGPTEAFIENYGTRVHHIAFDTSDIEKTVSSLSKDGLSFLLELVGSPEEGLKQIFTKPSPHTMLVTEYIHRYGGFTGFFTRSNVERLTAATGRQ
jgi:hypothetical protein